MVNPGLSIQNLSFKLVSIIYGVFTMATKQMKITAIKESILILETDLRMASKSFDKDVKRMQWNFNKENVDTLQNRIYAVLEIGGQIEELVKELKLLEGGK